MARCKPKGAQPATDSPPRAACELNVVEMRDDLCMNVFKLLLAQRLT